jgi:histidine ammonia-lyase/phenylalanine ammonia-lyase
VAGPPIDAESDYVEPNMSDSIHDDETSSRLRLDGESLSASQVYDVATNPAKYVLEVSADAGRRMDSSVRCKDDLIEAGNAVYGVTTGFGDSSGRQIGAQRSVGLQRNLLRFLRVGSGAEAPDDVVRATMLIRANCAARGNSGIRQEPVRLLLDMLAHDILPCVPERGSVGASGDLAPLSYVASAVTGEGVVRARGQLTQASDALHASGLRPVELQSKEGLALVNGTSFMAAYLSLALSEALELVWVAEACTALITEVRRTTDHQFAPFPHVHKPHPGQVDSAAQIYRMLDGSRLTVRDAAATMAEAGDEDGYIELHRRLQDPYSVRCAPHVIGVLRDTARWVEDWLTIEINSSNDNPLFDAATATVHNSGNFYGGHVAQAAQALTMAAASVADLVDRQLQLIVDEKFSLGLPPNLVPPLPPGDASEGLHHGFKGAQIAASALTAEALHLTVPAGSFSRSTESHNQDKVSMGTIAARHARTAVGLSLDVAAIHLVALCQAGDLVGADGLAPLTGSIHAYLRQHVAFLDSDRPLDADIELVSRMLVDGRLRREVGEVAQLRQHGDDSAILP